MPDKEDQYLESKEELERYGFNRIERFVSFDAADKENLERITKSLNIKKFNGTVQQLSLTLAHLTLLKKLVDSQDSDELLIFEDDVSIHTNFAKLTPIKLQKVEKYGILYLGASALGNTSDGSDLDGASYEGGVLMTHAYTMTKKAAQFILEQVQIRESCIIDQMYSNWFRKTGIPLWVVINTPHTSKNHKQLRTHNECITGLIFQKMHESTVLKK
jgi:GR25 family glycosyltransferase involved in LPS biosynthesis